MRQRNTRDSMSRTKVDVTVYTLQAKHYARGDTLHSMEKVVYKTLVHVESLNQPGEKQDALVHSGCGYYVLNSCIELLKASMLEVLSYCDRSQGTNPIMKHFEKFDFAQRKAIAINKLTVLIQDFVKGITERDGFLQSIDRVTKNEVLLPVRLLFQDRVQASSPLVKDRSRRLTFKKVDLNRSYQRISDTYARCAQWLKTIVQEFQTNRKRVSFSAQEINVAVRKGISEKADTALF